MFDVRGAGVHGVTCESGEHWNFISKTDDNFLTFLFGRSKIGDDNRKSPVHG